MKKISFIIPFYKGNQYINRVINSINHSFLFAKANQKENFLIEVIVVNDSPEVKMVNLGHFDFNIKVHINEINSGIHNSRVNGLAFASGDYIIFLDQDDIITKQAILNYINYSEDFDVLVSNGLIELVNNKLQYIYKNEKVGNLTTELKSYIKWKNLIISPGHCMIKKSSIPKLWKETTLEKNGVDDFFLWILMLDDKKNFKYIHKVNYIHKYTGNNFSQNRGKMYESVDQLLYLLKNNNILDKKITTMMIRYIKYRKIFRKNFILFVLYSLIHPILLVNTLYYEVLYRHKRYLDDSKSKEKDF